MKKKIAIISLLVLMILVQGCSGKDMTAGLEDGEIVATAIDNTLKLESVEFNSSAVFQTNSIFQPIDMTVIGKSKIFNEPILIESNYKILNNITGDQEEQKRYLHLLDDKLIGYVLQEGVWFQGEDLLFPEEILNNPTQNLNLFVTNQSEKGFITKDNAKSEGNLIKYDLAGDPSIYLWVLNQSFLNINFGSFAQEPDALEALGDFVLSIYVNKTNLNIEKMELNFSENLNRFGAYLKEKGEAPENLYELFEEFSYEVVYNLNNHNKLERFNVPLEARMGTRIE